MATSDSDYEVEETSFETTISKTNKQLSNEQRTAIVQSLIRFSDRNKKLKYGAAMQVAKEFGVHRNTVDRLWKRGVASLQTGSVCMDVKHRKANCGRKKKDYFSKLQQINKVPLNKRGTQRSTAASLGIPTTTLHRRLKEGALRMHSNTVKPHLSETAMKERSKFCKSFLRMESGDFDDMKNVIHVDEKWFYLTKNNRKFYLAPEEKNPHRMVKSRRYGTKVMFLAAVARPRWDQSKNSIFDGKIGMWPIVTTEPAKRNSVNRVAGTPVTKALNVDTKVYRDLIINKVVPAIVEKWPQSQRKNTVKIQQDNAPVHIKPTDPAFVAAVENSNMDIQLVFQPPNSPDLNVLDLGFFNAIQTLQYQANPKNIDELIEAVATSFNKLELQKLDNIFLTLQKVMECVILAKGSNNFAIPHSTKRHLERVGQLRIPSIVISDELRTAIALSELDASTTESV